MAVDHSQNQTLQAFLETFESADAQHRGFSIADFLEKIEQFHQKGEDLNSIRTSLGRNALGVLCYMIENNPYYYQSPFGNTEFAKNLINNTQIKPTNYAFYLLRGLAYTKISDDDSWLNPAKWDKPVIDFTVELMEQDAKEQLEPPGISWWDEIQNHASNDDFIRIQQRMNVLYQDAYSYTGFSKKKEEFLPELYQKITEGYYTRRKLEKIGEALKEDLLRYIDEHIEQPQKYEIFKNIADAIVKAKYDPSKINATKDPLAAVILAQRSYTAVSRNSPSIKLLDSMLLKNRPMDEEAERTSILGEEQPSFFNRYFSWFWARNSKEKSLANSRELSKIDPPKKERK